MTHSSKFMFGLILAAIAVLSTNTYAGSSRSTTYEAGKVGPCPPGFSPIPSGLACAADNLTIEPTTELPPVGDCPPGFERVPGVRFCVASNLTIEIPSEMMLLEAVINDDCPENFSRPVGSTICVADNLVLDSVEREVKLVKFNFGCPEGFHRPVGVRFCIAENLKATELPLPSDSDCPPGFTRPPGVRFCVATNILNADYELINGLEAPKGECPEGWQIGPNGFCMPENKTAGCVDECGLYEFDLLKVENTSKSALNEACERDQYDLWWDMPVFDAKGRTIVGFVKTKSCAAKTVTYMPQGSK